MSVYDRSSARDIQIIDLWDNGFGWLAHPEEEGKRSSHAISGEDGVWVIDAVDAQGLDGLLEDLGEVPGVTVVCSYHTRDADTVATRHDVPVYIPRWMDRVADRVDAPLK